MKKGIVAGFLIISSLVFVAPVFAVGRPTSLPTPAGLTQGRLKACQAVESGVKNRMQSLINLATNIENVFSSIATRVETYYKDKVVPTGKTLANYDTLVANISTNKSTIDTDLASAQTMVNDFSCTSGNPKGLLTDFRVDMQKVKTDLKNFRTSIKNLIVAVRTVSPKESPKPTESPEATP